MKPLPVFLSPEAFQNTAMVTLVVILLLVLINLICRGVAWLGTLIRDAHDIQDDHDKEEFCD